MLNTRIEIEMILAQREEKSKAKKRSIAEDILGISICIMVCGLIGLVFKLIS